MNKSKIQTIGSDSPTLSERTGARYGTFAAGFMVFHGADLVKENYYSGYMSRGQFDDVETSEKLLSLLATNLERDVALKCLDKEKPDLLLIDGPFFGFAAQCERIRNRRIDTAGYVMGEVLIQEIRDKSIQLMNTKKAVGVIKRLRTIAIDSWLLYKHGSIDACINKNDKAILSAIMPENTTFSYASLLGSSEAVNYFRRLKQQYEVLFPKIGKRTMDYFLNRAQKVSELQMERALGGRVNEIYSNARYFYRANFDAQPFCFEAHRDMKVDSLLSYFKENCNAATGLPFPIDLMDQNVTLPRRFTKEFVEEVEALLIKDPEMGKVNLANHFMSINPQKEE